MYQHSAATLQMVNLICPTHFLVYNTLKKTLNSFLTLYFLLIKKVGSCITSITPPIRHCTHQIWIFPCHVIFLTCSNQPLHGTFHQENNYCVQKVIIVSILLCIELDQLNTTSHFCSPCGFKATLPYSLLNLLVHVDQQESKLEWSLCWISR